MSWKKNSNRNFNLNQNTTPINIGPGSYNIEEKNNKFNNLINNTPRKCIPFGQKNEKSPGPGSYEINNNELLKDKPTNSFKSQTKREVYNFISNPSPTDYNNIENWNKKKKKLKKKKLKKFNLIVLHQKMLDKI